MKRAEPSARAVKHAHQLIALLMKEMHASLRDQERLSPEQWDKLFGAKQSMIANLHKLVSALVALPDKGEAQEAGMREALPLSAKEMEMLTAWLAEKEA